MPAADWMGAVISLDGRSLTAAALVAIVDGGGPVDVDPAAWAGVEGSHATMLAAVTRRPVYGRTTGVGGNLAVSVDDGAGLRLLRSHVGGAGAFVDGRAARAMLVVRANQLLVGAAGVAPALIEAIVAAINTGAYPAIREFGSIGTGDLAALAALGLSVIGERPWIGAGPDPVAIDNLDALALLSSSALTVAQATLAATELARLADAATTIAALSIVALRGSVESFAAEVQNARPHPGAVAIATRLRELLDPPPEPSGRTQDPYGIRALAPVHGVLFDALGHLGRVLAIELNAGSENPLISGSADDVFHHGNFHQASLAAALDGVRLALLSSAQLGQTRLGALMNPSRTGLTPFLADGPGGSSGLMITEYTAASALAALRAAASPVTGGHAVLSLGAEEHASFAPQAVRQTVAAIEAYRIGLAVELVAAVRVLRQAGREPASAALRAAYGAAQAALPGPTEDRPLEDDLAIAIALVPGLGRDEPDGSTAESIR